MKTFECLPQYSLLVKTGLLVVTLNCAVVHAQEGFNIEVAESSAIEYPRIDPDLGEALYPQEENISQQISFAIEKSLRATYSAGEARRDAHPKAHGCVKAEFQILESLPEQLAQGIFIPGKTYPAWIRFSNGSKDPTHADIEKDARGVAIKVLGVPGKKLLDEEGEATTQDFIMINHPVFFANDPQRYLSFVKKGNSDSFFKKVQIPFALGFKGTRILWKTVRTEISNPLQTRYWSMVPYQLGEGPNRQAVKYSVRPCTPGKDPIPDNPAHDFLRDAMRTTLDEGDACMEFLVQPRTTNSMAVEDSMTEWKESEAPFYEVATLHIPQQRFDTDAQNQFCEDLSFNPWHALPAHKPLGVTNRMRKNIYDHISRVRHEMNAAPRQEPH